MKFRSLVGLKLANDLDGKLAKLDGIEIDEGLIDATRVLCEKMCKDDGKSFYEQFTQPMEVKVEYRGAQLKVPCKSTHEVFLLKMGTKVKNKGVANGKLPLLWCEAELCEPCVDDMPAVSADVLRPCLFARQAASQLLDNDSCHSGVAIKGVLESKNADTCGHR